MNRARLILFALPFAASLVAADPQATVSGTPGARTFTLTTDTPLRDNFPPDHRRVLTESTDLPRIITGNTSFDAFYALALAEARENSVESIHDGAFNHGAPFPLHAFETGRKWTYVWTRDLAYSTDLGLASFDPARCVESLLFKTSPLKKSVQAGFTNQIIQDTGSGGSYPVSSDRVVWALGASATLNYLDGLARDQFLQLAWPILHDTIEQDRALIFDPADGLYRGEESFLDWREQTYPGWTRDNVLPIATSKSLSTCVAHYILLKTDAELAARLGKQVEAGRYSELAGQLGPPSTTNSGTIRPASTPRTSWTNIRPFASAATNSSDNARPSSPVLPAQRGLHGSLLRIPSVRMVPPVVWPQEKTVPIYHNQAIWPFVTAYWLKAARATGNAAAVLFGIQCQKDAALANLSNMENFDWVTGAPEADINGIKGPVISSQRQLWSVAAALSAVQDIIFGLETSWDGIRFRPFIPNGLFPGATTVKLEHFNYRGKTIAVTIHLPAQTNTDTAAFTLATTTLNGAAIGDDFVPVTKLATGNLFEIWLQNPAPTPAQSLRMITNMFDTRFYFGPIQPEWRSGITARDGKLVLNFESPGESNIIYNIYRDGRRVASGVTNSEWTDNNSTDYTRHIHFYGVEAEYPESSNASHLTPPAYFTPEGVLTTIPASQMKNHGGALTDAHHFRDWGRAADELATEFIPKSSGLYLIRAEYANGSGPINTGITCGVKRLDIRDDTGRVVCSSSVILPQTGDWRRYLLSSPVRTRLEARRRYTLRLFEDETTRNMSYLEKNRIYTAFPGGGADPVNFVDVSAFQILAIESDVKE